MASKSNFIFVLSSSVIIFIILGFVGVSFFSKKIEDSDNEKVAFQKEGALPLSFPLDFPIYPGSKISSSWTSEGDSAIGVSVIWESTDSVGKVMEFYKSELVKNGWSITNEFDNNQSFTISFKKGKSEGFIGISSDGRTSISATIGIEK